MKAMSVVLQVIAISRQSHGFFWQVRDFVLFVFSLLTRGPFRRRFIAYGFPFGGKPSRGQSGYGCSWFFFFFWNSMYCARRGRRWSGAGWRR